MIENGQLSSVTPWVEDGNFQYYDESGELYSTGAFTKGKLTGDWIYYTDNKSDTVRYNEVEKYYSNGKDSCKENQSKISQSNLYVDTLTIKKEILGFIESNLHMPARSLNNKANLWINTKIIIDTNGYINCPEFTNFYHIDFNFELLRVLFMYKCNIKISHPICLTLPVFFNSLDNNEPIFVFVEEQALFQGGDVDYFRKYIEKILIYPEEAARSGIQGKVIAQFVINKKGYLVDGKILRSVDPLLDNEVLRCLTTSPVWVAARQNGKPVKQQFVIPVSFTLGRPKTSNW
jgi:TonB family protein